jgi:hypothetical protein
MSVPETDDALVAALARASIERAAPEELPLFRATSAAYFDDPAALERRSGDEMLGFGAEAAIMLVTPVALSVARDVIAFLVQQLKAQAAKEGEGAVRGLIARILHRDGKEGADGAPGLTDDQLAQVRALAIEKAKQLKLADDKAELLAESLVGSLATA